MKTVESQLGAVARPARVFIVPALPKTRSGKLLRRAIQAVCEGRDTGDLTTIEDAGALDGWVGAVPGYALRLARALWPAPLTLVVPRGPRAGNHVTGGQDTVGLRAPDHPVAQALLAGFGGGVAAPSANRFGRVSPTTAAHVLDELGEALVEGLDVVLHGERLG